MRTPSPDLELKLGNLPDLPGVYLMKDESGIIIYIGKASSLKKRVSSYFHRGDHDTKTTVLVRSVNDLEYIVTDTEIEALILESSLVRKHKPRFNIRLKDDKRFPYIAATLKEDYPRIIFTRKLRHDGSRYFGPYTDARAARNTVHLINTIFKLRTCKKELPLKGDERPCLNYQIKRCHGACQGKMSREEYRSLIENAMSFLGGNIEPVLQDLKRQMNQHAQNLEYEKAAALRDVLYDIQQIMETQKVYTPVGKDQDFIGIRIIGDEALVVLFEFRGGVLLGSKISVYDHAHYWEAGDVLSTFLAEYYTRTDIPTRIILSREASDRGFLENYLSQKSGHRVHIITGRIREDLSVLSLIDKNLDVLIAEREAGKAHSERESGLEELRNRLALPRPPEVMECFDISNIQGKQAVASMVQFRDGWPDKSQYRRYRIRGYDSPNDPGMIHEVVARRLQYLQNEALDIPDLLVIDGGITQLTRAREASQTLGIEIRIISLAKRFEEIYYDPAQPPIRLPKDSTALRILQQMRDEAHRFAITYHRKTRGHEALSSKLDEIQGVGKEKRSLLLDHFKTFERIKNASMEELEAVPSLGKNTAKAVFRFFHSGPAPDSKQDL